MLKTILVSSIVFITIILVTILGSVFYYNYQINKKVIVPVDKSIIKIEKGATTDEIANQLLNLGIIDFPEILKIYLTIHSDKIIQAGMFQLPENVSLVDAIEIFEKGPSTKRLTFLEGWRTAEYVDYLEKQMGKNYADTFSKSELIKEGYMYPDTYIIELDYPPEDLASTIRNTFDKKVGEEILAKGFTKELSPDEVVILASIVEREMNDPKQMPIVAGILLNRLKAGWALQADATIQYARGKKGSWWPRISGSDIDNTSSPYNSYKNKGLPPGPICNPSNIAINAVVNAVDTEYYFYLTGKDGKTYYAKTLEEHNENVAKYLR